MKNIFELDWSDYNNGYPLYNEEIERYISVIPSENQIRHNEKPFYAFIHFGMNTATAREWGSGKETVDDFTIKSIDARQWVSTIKKSGATGIILTCKHHDGFCLWNSEYTDFCVKNTDFDGDIVKMVSDECHNQNMDFGVYLSPWDMHDSRYGTSAYNDYFCNQLTELLSNYGEIFEVWFDGAKGKNAVDFEYDWERYYDLIHKLQPNANIAICGKDIRWVGNEAGKSRKAEYSVVPEYLTRAETVAENSQHTEADANSMKRVNSKNEDLGSREILKNCDTLCWYPAEVDVSIRRGWFYSKNEDKTVKSAKRLFNIYLKSVGNNCSLLLNIPPTDKGIIHDRDAKALQRLGEKIEDITKNNILTLNDIELTTDKSYIEYDFDEKKRVRYITLSEDIRFSQRVEAFDLYLKTPNKKYKLVYSGTVIGGKKIIKLRKVNAIGFALVVRQSRSNPIFKEISLFE